MRTGLDIGVDLDGVCYNFQDSLARYLRYYKIHKEYGYTIDEPISWEFYAEWGMSLEEFLKHCHDGANAGFIFGKGEPHEGSVSSLSFMKAMGNRIHIITDRSFGDTPAVSENLTIDWLDRHGFEYDSLTFSADKTCVKTDFFIEDKLQNYDALDATSCKPYLVNRSWNTLHGDDNRRRVRSIGEFASTIGYISS